MHLTKGPLVKKPFKNPLRRDQINFYLYGLLAWLFVNKKQNERS